MPIVTHMKTMKAEASFTLTTFADTPLLIVVVARQVTTMVSEHSIISWNDALTPAAASTSASSDSTERVIPGAEANARTGLSPNLRLIAYPGMTSVIASIKVEIMSFDSIPKIILTKSADYFN